LVHLETDEDHRPDTYQLLKIEADDGLEFESIELSSLSPAWKSDELENPGIRRRMAITAQDSASTRAFSDHSRNHGIGFSIQDMQPLPDCESLV
jgi:hypothetical protein